MATSQDDAEAEEWDFGDDEESGEWDFVREAVGMYRYPILFKSCS